MSPPAETDGQIRLSVILSPEDMLSGSVSAGGGGETIPFHGWLAFMAAINALRDRASRLPVEGRPH